MDSNIYTNTLRYAREHGELDSYRENLRQNTACAAAIDTALKADHRDMPGALTTVREQFGLDRPAWLLAGYLREQGWDGRYSQTNVEWAKGFDVPLEQSSRVALKPHPVYLNELVDATRAELAVRERNQVVKGYKILESTVFVDDRGFALAENPDAPQPFVTWQFTETDSGRDHYWGHYKTDADSARQDFHTRVQEYRNDYDLAENLPPAGHPCEHGYSSKFAEKLLDSMEDTRQCTLFSTDEKNLVCNYAFHTGDPIKTRLLADALAATRFGMDHGGGVPPDIADRVNAEIAAIDEHWARLDAVSPIATIEMSTEQNLNQIDGLRNNMTVPPADLTDGQTHEELRELAPKSTPAEKPSVLGKIQEARLTPTMPKEQHTPKKATRGEER